MGKAEQLSDDTVAPSALMEACWQGDHTVPVPGTYPHQWYTDSSLAAIGWSHIRPERGATEILTLLRGQWSNGMIPHQIYKPKLSRGGTAINDRRLWSKGVNPLMPAGIKTSEITQPPILAEAAWTVARKLPADDRRAFLATAVPGIQESHQWAYRERDFGDDGLITTIHPYESGMNYAPYWIGYIKDHPVTARQRLLGRLPIERVVKLVRPDIVNDEGEVSLSLQAGILAVLATRDLGKLGTDPVRIKEEWPYQIEDVLFNSVMIRNNQILMEMAAETGITLPDILQANMRRTERGLDKLYVPDTDDPAEGQYYSRTTAGQHLDTPTIASLMPVYSGVLTPGRAAAIEAQLKDSGSFGLRYPIPTVPVNSPNFNPKIQDEGAVKPPLNWLVVKGLEHSGRIDTARQIARKTIALAESHQGSHSKYYSPLTGDPGDQNRASTTAAVAKDVLAIANAPLLVLSLIRAGFKKRAA